MNAPLLYSILAIWSVFGFIYYMGIMDDVKGYKSVILTIMSGPIIWFLYILSNIFGAVHNWLTKE